MMENRLGKSVGMVAFGALPVVAAVVLAGPSAADATVGHAAPVAGIPLEKSEDIATDPHALIPDPVLNGSVGSAVGSATGSGGSLLGSVIGALVGFFRPDVIPQVLP
ncbi:MAG: hypothetical protein HOQ44_00195 [Nocardia sp.]|nr:hypothetical protein [Nocardia sp.]